MLECSQHSAVRVTHCGRKADPDKPNPVRILVLSAPALSMSRGLIVHFSLFSYSD